MAEDIPTWVEPTVEDCWRGIVLYGRNTASYKFALASALLNLKPSSGELVKLEDLAPVYAQLIAEHMRTAPKQINNGTGKFLQSCLAFNKDNDLSKLVDSTVANGFNEVIGRFHIVGSDLVHHPFFVDERKDNRGIRITEEFSQLIAGKQASNLAGEVASRWHLVETAWGENISANLLTIHHDNKQRVLYVKDRSHRRRSVTSSRNALCGYQNGRCFYCSKVLTLGGPEGNADVDHFFPYSLQRDLPNVDLDSLWNLVVACSMCNRGREGKSARIPAPRFLQRLHRRNEHVFRSHLPLRETLMQQTGKGEEERRGFLTDFYQRVQKMLGLSSSSVWEPKST